ncbi:unnamed protein product [Onchocerca flexuosa]|uniref:Uncharacterized protein n=1 Tax=Onchocerca flexuosa TaxID=387005 RepID=A0A183GY21_9BILA|nr:unnamed protein product [Onchocerca flexuosa]
MNRNTVHSHYHNNCRIQRDSLTKLNLSVLYLIRHSFHRTQFTSDCQKEQFRPHN